MRSLGLALVAIIACAPSGEFTGRVVGIADGDTLLVLDSTNQQHKIRLNGIDAPESHQAFGERAKQFLAAKVFGKELRVVTKKIDYYHRQVADVFIGDRLINKEMVEEGWAWHFVKYSNDPELTAAENRARAAKLGLWADAHPVAPWDFRSPKLTFAALEAEAAADPKSVTVYVTDTGTKYHRASCRHVAKSSIPKSLDEAKKTHSPCSVCKPPR
jgi:micrococcal nuclease